MNTGDKLEVFQEFYDFLVSHNSLESYITNIKNDLHDNNEYSIDNLIDSAFNWDISPESSIYWSILAIDWKKLGNTAYSFTCQEIHDFLISNSIPQNYEYW